MSNLVRAIVEIAKDTAAEGHELVDGLDDLGGHVGAIRSAVRYVQRRRLKRFLRAVTSRQEELTDDERRTLDEQLASKAGQEFLADAVDAVLRTSSTRATAALGLLVGDPSEERYSKSFRRNACEALRGLPDHQVDLFLGLLDAARVIPRTAGKTVQDGDYQTELGTWRAPMGGPGGTVVQGVSMVINLLPRPIALDHPTLRLQTNQLTVRGLLLPEARTPIDAPDFLNFAFGSDSVAIEDLLQRAGKVPADDDA